jgi:hypothetical protein
MSTNALAAYIAVESAGGFTTLHEWGETTLGMVTGNNRYFAMSPARARELGLRSNELLALSPLGSSHLRGLTFTAAAYPRQLTCALTWPNSGYSSPHTACPFAIVMTTEVLPISRAGIE